MTIDWFGDNDAASVAHTAQGIVPDNDPTPQEQAQGLIDSAGRAQVNHDRRRRATDFIVEPGEQARALCMLTGQPMVEFIAQAIDAKTETMRAKLRANNERA